jgi:histidinol-phosphatase (PHP family)
LTPEDLQATYLSFLSEAHRLKRAYAPQIDLLVGLETDFITDEDLDGLERLLQAEGDRIEFIMGGMHHVEEIPIDFDKDTYEKAVEACRCRHSRQSIQQDATASNDSSSNPQPDPRTAFFSSYFDSQYELITRIRPTVIAHIDLCRLYTPEIRLDDSKRFPGVWDKIIRNVEAVVEYGGLFEVSSAALRKGWQMGYPGEEILQVSWFYSMFSLFLHHD